jgi:hypothetical protein
VPPDFATFRASGPFGELKLGEQLLYTTFYSDAIIDSAEAKGAFVPPDLKPLPNLVPRQGAAQGGGGLLSGIVSWLSG